MTQTSSNAIEFRDVECRLPSGRVLLAQLNLAIKTGETLMLLGRSGSGKTTCLKMINRLIEASAGEISVQGKPLTRWNLIQLRRSIGYAIQDVGLFPHYNVRQNVSLVPKLEKWPQPRIDARVEQVLAHVGLPIGDFAGRYPNELSGGQRQRVGLARALAAEPPILLMDEPFGALDPITRAELQQQFRQLQHKLGKTVVFVTHDVSEALLLGDRIALMQDGRLHGVYEKREFLHSPDPTIQAYMDLFRAGQALLRD